MKNILVGTGIGIVAIFAMMAGGVPGGERSTPARPAVAVEFRESWAVCEAHPLRDGCKWYVEQIAAKAMLDTCAKPEPVMVRTCREWRAKHFGKAP